MQMTENEARKLKKIVQPKKAKAKARSRIFETSTVDGKGLKIEQHVIEFPSIIVEWNQDN